MGRLSQQRENLFSYNFRMSIRRAISGSCMSSPPLKFSTAYPNSLNILQVDNGRFHTSQDLVVPENIILLFQPPYCPELNPIERLWQYLKANLKWATFKTLDQLQTKVDQLLALLSPQVVASITGYAFILDALSALDTV